jgi:hypothetical protein
VARLRSSRVPNVGEHVGQLRVLSVQPGDEPGGDEQPQAAGSAAGILLEPESSDGGILISAKWKPTMAARDLIFQKNIKRNEHALPTLGNPYSNGYTISLNRFYHRWTTADETIYALEETP